MLKLSNMLPDTFQNSDQEIWTSIMCQGKLHIRYFYTYELCRTIIFQNLKKLGTSFIKILQISLLTRQVRLIHIYKVATKSKKTTLEETKYQPIYEQHT